MANYLVVVESPAKAKTIKKYLGTDYTVKASVGHVKDLPKSKLGVDIAKGFTPVYEVSQGKNQVLKEIKTAAKKADKVFLATDPDREGDDFRPEDRERSDVSRSDQGGGDPRNTRGGLCQVAPG